MRLRKTEAITETTSIYLIIGILFFIVLYLLLDMYMDLEFKTYNSRIKNPKTVIMFILIARFILQMYALYY